MASFFLAVSPLLTVPLDAQNLTGVYKTHHEFQGRPVDLIVSVSGDTTMEAGELNNHMLDELKKIRKAMTSDQALDIVLASLDQRIKDVQGGGTSPLALAVNMPMFW